MWSTGEYIILDIIDYGNSKAKCPRENFAGVCGLPLISLYIESLAATRCVAYNYNQTCLLQARRCISVHFVD